MQSENTIKQQMLFNILHTPVDILKAGAYTENKVQVSVLRLDKIHPAVSGNKIFKLHYFLKEAMASQYKSIITFGGAYSNHLAATAYACKITGIKCTGIVRGEQPKLLSHTLQFCMNNGMQLQFISRQQYAEKEDSSFIQTLKNNYGECTIIPEGGYGTEGANGAVLIHQLIKPEAYTHICTAAGTATTAAGILMGATNETVVCVPVLKGMEDIEQRISVCTNNCFNKNQLQVFDEYHFGGYAKKTPELISFMNELWRQHQLPTDFVYTAKMMYAITDKIKQGYFAPGSNVLCLHTGGLQGNLSLPKNSLTY